MCGCRGSQRSVGRRMLSSPSFRSVGLGPVRATPRQLQLRAALDAAEPAESVGLTKAQRDIERRRRAAIVRRQFGK